MPKMSLLENELSAALSKDLDFVVEGIRRKYSYRQDRFHEARSFSGSRCDWARQREAL
jgi:hypothetical protein